LKQKTTKKTTSKMVNLFQDKTKTTTVNNNEHIKTEDATAQMAHLVLPNTQANPSQNQKSHFLPTHLTTITNLTLTNC
jgi:hypothetical protein